MLRDITLVSIIRQILSYTNWTACKIICDNDIYYCAVYVPGHFGICDHNRYAYFYDQNFKSTVFVYRKRVKSHCGAAFDYGSV